MSDDLPIGAHLTSPRRGYVHHGIYVGGGRVIHYSGFSSAFRAGPVREVSLEEFTRGRGYAVRPRVAPGFSAESIVARARSRVGEDSYRFWSNNCEHFCEWCIDGRSRSAQVERWLPLLRRVARVSGALGVRALAA
ncbi:MAG TPA: lecithin retinol acyltransferase family protein [Burkholderiaceae bacterium]|jgi:hypothetical protein|nr:lecithin retinol acyltransferase family protein [Burkholderiaceae bacterium]